MNEALMPFTDLMSNIEAWASWVPRDALRPVFQVDPHGGPSERPALTISGTGSEQNCGCWQLPLPALVSGRRYRIEALFIVATISCGGRICTTILLGICGINDKGDRGQNTGDRKFLFIFAFLLCGGSLALFWW